MRTVTYPSAVKGAREPNSFNSYNSNVSHAATPPDHLVTLFSNKKIFRNRLFTLVEYTLHYIALLILHYISDDFFFGRIFRIFRNFNNTHYLISNFKHYVMLVIVSLFWPDCIMSFCNIMYFTYCVYIGTSSAVLAVYTYTSIPPMHTTLTQFSLTFL